MKVALIGGPFEYSVCLANALSKQCEVDFFYNGRSARHRGDTILTLLDSSTRIFETNSYRVRDPRNFFSYRRLAKYLNNYDIIHIQSSDIWLNLHRYLCRDVPIVSTIHDPVVHVGLPWIKGSFQKIAQIINISQTATFIVHGERLKSILASVSRVPEGNISVLPHGEFSFYRKLRKDTNEIERDCQRTKRILFFGEIRKNKGLDYLIRAEPLISSRYKDYKICIAGRFKKEKGNNAEYYCSLMQDPSRFEIHDRFIGNHEVADFFEKSDVVALPYIGASQSGILAIAFGFGKPVVATDTGSIGEILENGRTGLLVPPADERALADALLRMLCNDDERRQFGVLAAAEASTRLNWDVIAEQTMGVYNRVKLGG